jgi:hypothetical protein
MPERERPLSEQFRVVAKAWAEHCRRSALATVDRAAKDAWYRSQVKGVLGVDTTRGADPVRDFDRLMLHFATLANDDYWIKRCSVGEETRALHQLQRTIDNAARAGVDISDAYLAGIAKHMGFGDRPLDQLPAAAVLKVRTAISLHWQRKKKEALCAAPF